MAHRSLTHPGLAAGLAATLLFTASGQAVALDGGAVSDTVDETQEALDEATGGLEDASGQSAEPVTDAVQQATDAVTETADGVRDVVDKAASGDPGGAVESATDTVGGTVEGTTDAVRNVVGGVVDGGGAEAGGGDEPRPVPPSGGPSAGGSDTSDVPHRTASAPRFEPDGGFADRSASISSGFSRNIGGGAGSPSSFEPPATGGAFDPSSEDAGDSAQEPDIASLSQPAGPSTAGVPNPRDIPTSLMLTATALLVLVGAGHVLHAVRRGGLQFG